MGDHDPGFALFMDQVGEDLDHLIGAFGVQAGGGFIGQHDAGVVDQGAGDGDALFLPAGELSRACCSARSCKPEPVDQFLGALASMPVEFLVHAQHQLDIFHCTFR